MGNIMFSVTPMKRVHTFEYFKKVFVLFKNSLNESNLGILCPQVLTVAGMAVLEITHIPFCLIVRRYHFTLAFSQCMEKAFTVSTIHFFFPFFFFLSPPTPKEEKTLCRMLRRRVLNSGTCT